MTKGAYCGGVEPQERRPILLSPPSIVPDDLEAVQQGMQSGWAAPAGPLVAKFEADVSRIVGVPHAVALSSGTAALQLGLKGVGVRAGDWVILPTLSFAAPAFAAAYESAQVAFVDVTPDTWTMDPNLVEDAVARIQQLGGRVGAILPVDAYGNPADYDQLLEIAHSRSIPLFEDAAEALGSVHDHGPAGTFGAAAAISFNGNKIVTTGGGGMLVSHDSDLIDRVRYWSQQSRSTAPWYEHEEIGYNLRLSSILASFGISQVSRLTAFVQSRRTIRNWYEKHLSGDGAITFLQDPPWGKGNAWLTVARFDSDVYPDAVTRVREKLDGHRVESRPVFKPLHLQPVFHSSLTVQRGISEGIFRESLCLPSGSDLSEADVEWISTIVKSALRECR